MKIKFLAVLVMLMVAWLANPISAQLADSPWPMFHHDARHTGRNPYIKGPENSVLKWRFQTGGEIDSSPAIGTDGTVYVGSDDGYLYAINPNGIEKWRFKKFQTSSIDSSPAIGADGTIYVGSDKGFLYAINPNGTEKWRFGTAGSIISSPAIGSDGTIYVGPYDNSYLYIIYLYAINPNGTEEWRFQNGTPGSGFFSSPAISTSYYHNGYIYVGLLNGYLCAINGGLEWKISTGAIYSSPAIGADGTIYVGSSNYLCAIQEWGTFEWQFRAGDYAFDSSPAIGADGTIYVGSDDGYLYAVNRTEKWRFQTGGDVDSSPAIDADGIVYVGSDDGYLYAINPNGTEKWRFQTGGEIDSSPAIGADGIVYVGSDDSFLYAIGESRITPTPTLTLVPNPTPTRTPTPVKNITFLLHIKPEQESFSYGDNFKLTLDLQTPAVPKVADIYFVMTCSISNHIWFGMNWDTEPKPTIKNITIPANLVMSGAPLLEIRNIPSYKPPIGYKGKYTFIIACTEPDTLNFISNLGAVSFIVE